MRIIHEWRATHDAESRSHYRGSFSPVLTFAIIRYLADFLILRKKNVFGRGTSLDREDAITY